MTGDLQKEETFTFHRVTHNAEQTQQLGMCLGRLLRGGELLLLDGQLGAGKTTFTQGLARGMNITTVVSSPTFTLLKEYQGQPQPSTDEQAGKLHTVGPALYHFDLYRLDDPDEMIDLGFEDYFYSAGVCVVEWADKALWSLERLEIHLKASRETERGISFVATGTRYCELLRQFQKNVYATASF